MIANSIGKRYEQYYTVLNQYFTVLEKERKHVCANWTSNKEYWKKKEGMYVLIGLV